MIIIRIAFVAICFSGLVGFSTPNKPDPSEVLREAERDHDAGRYAEALEKHIWFFDNALKYESSLNGVRLSFALGDWVLLANKYSPALEALEEKADEAEGKVRSGVEPYKSFQDFKSINEDMDKEERTVSLFSWLDKEKPDLARKVYRLARKALVKEGRYELCGSYIDPDKEFQAYLRDFRDIQERELKGPLSEHIKEFRHDSFSYHSSLLVALLVKNGRYDEADSILEMALEEWDGEEFKMKIENARKGIMPAPWP
jgi:hypothetical protein